MNYDILIKFDVICVLDLAISFTPSPASVNVCEGCVCFLSVMSLCYLFCIYSYTESLCPVSTCLQYLPKSS